MSFSFCCVAIQRRMERHAPRRQTADVPTRRKLNAKASVVDGSLERVVDVDNIML